MAPVYNHFGFYNWNGFYLGLNGGGHWSSDSDLAGVTANTFLTGNNLAIMNAALPATFNAYEVSPEADRPATTGSSPPSWSASRPTSWA